MVAKSCHPLLLHLTHANVVCCTFFCDKTSLSCWCCSPLFWTNSSTGTDRESCSIRAMLVVTGCNGIASSHLPSSVYETLLFIILKVRKLLFFFQSDLFLKPDSVTENYNKDTRCLSDTSAFSLMRGTSPILHIKVHFQVVRKYYTFDLGHKTNPFLWFHKALHWICHSASSDVIRINVYYLQRRKWKKKNKTWGCWLRRTEFTRTFVARSSPIDASSFVYHKPV